MNEELPQPDVKKFQRVSLASMTSMLPAYLKDPANYEKIQLALLNAGATKHSHADVESWAKCATCQRAEWNRKEMMLKLGFKSGKQYLAWKKIHDEIKSRAIIT